MPTSCKAWLQRFPKLELDNWRDVRRASSRRERISLAVLQCRHFEKGAREVQVSLRIRHMPRAIDELGRPVFYSLQNHT